MILIRSAHNPLIRPRDVRPSHADDSRNARLIRNRYTGDVILSSISHMRLARNRDRIHFTVAETP